MFLTFIADERRRDVLRHGPYPPPKGLNAGELQSALETLAGSLMVDITLRKDG